MRLYLSLYDEHLMYDIVLSDEADEQKTRVLPTSIAWTSSEEECKDTMEDGKETKAGADCISARRRQERD